MRNDPIVEEVRQARAGIEAECGNDLQKLAEFARRKEQELQQQGFKIIRSWPAKRDKA